MAYQRNNLISRTGYSGIPPRYGVGDWWDAISDAAGGVLKFYGSAQQAQGAAAASQQTNRDLVAALAAQQNAGMTTLLIVGAVGVGAYLLIRSRQ